MWMVPLGTRHGTSLPGTSHLQSTLSRRYIILLNNIFPASHASNNTYRTGRSKYRYGIRYGIYLPYLPYRISANNGDIRIVVRGTLPFVRNYNTAPLK